MEEAVVVEVVVAEVGTVEVEAAASVGAEEAGVVAFVAAEEAEPAGAECHEVVGARSVVVVCQAAVAEPCEVAECLVGASVGA